MTMSHQHTDIDTESDQEQKAASCTLERFTRNRYFNGKLMTARDMQAEQAYHAARLETIAQHVLGEGVVCGLDTTVTAGDDGGVDVSVTAGVALDCCGRPVVVDGDDELSFDATEVSKSEGFSLFIELEPCDTEKVPMPGSQDACSENCEYNRVVEDYTIVAVEGRPAERKPVPEVEFPTQSELAQANTHDDATEPHQMLSKAARTYNRRTDASGALGYVGCDTGGDPAVFLAYYEWSAGAWEHKPKAEPRHHVYSNDLLYAGLARHAADFDNPHEVHLAVEELEGGVETLLRNERHLSTEGSPPYPGDVTFSSPDDTLAIEGSSSSGVGEVTFDLGDDEQTTLGKVEPLETTVEDHLAAENPHDVVSALAGDGTAVPPADGLVDLVSNEGIHVEATPDESQVGVGLDQEALEDLVRDFLEELVGPFDAEDWEQVRNAIRNVNGVGGDEEGGLTMASETVAIDEDEDNSTITIEIGQDTLDRLDELESRLDALESDGVDLSGIDLTQYLPEYDTLRSQIDRLDTVENELQGLTDHVTTLDSNYDDVTSDLSTLQGQYNNVKGQVSTLEDQYSTVDSDLSSLQGTVQTVQSDVDEVSKDLANTASNLSALSTNLNDEHEIAVPQFDTSTLNLSLADYSDFIYTDTDFTGDYRFP